ncbi:hypothetical protein [Cognatishimia maritima]|uniref:Uncharacterized protein n=1 Tax=Cognatishimia maritima TaxID=870908 RepID=A0A1M5IP60_9RHOB|nr:hypothetical protein [Cognatishimia maritima]SHG30087.1 hypothetical protein SAMN04488044_0402 [Cognatishimia maritima]
MDYIDSLAEKLARDVLLVQKETNDLTLVQEIAAVLEASSSKMHEAFMTAVRVYDSEVRARQVLDAKIAAAAKAAGLDPDA